MKRLFIVFGLLVLVGLLFALGTRYIETLDLSGMTNGVMFLPVLLIAAFVDSVNPCAFSILVITIGFLFSLGKERKDVLSIGFSYIFGIFAVYLLIGLGILQALSFFNTPRFMSQIGALLLILWGVIDLLQLLWPGFPIVLKIPRAAHQRIAGLMERASLPASFALGAFVGLCEFPCTGGPYLVILGLLHDAATFRSGLGYLFLYNIVFVLPLLIILIAVSNRRLLLKIEEFKKTSTRRFGFISSSIMILLGILLLVYY